jgi:hypothetical protein
MRRSCCVLLALAGCHFHGRDHVDGGVLGRIVIYRNGVAFYERHATVEDGKLTVHVPRDKVDDFLKSLTVVDPVTHKQLSVTIPRKEADDGNYLTMTVETADKQHADVLLTYVTEAPAWKPSYRVVVGDKGTVMLEGWAVVDNTSSEDWKGVLVGVGASSALAFRYDLWSVHRVDRDLLQGEERFAIAPPTGVSPYAEGTATEELTSLDGSEIRGGEQYGVSFSGSTSSDATYIVDGVNTTGLTYGDTGSSEKKVVAAPQATGGVQGVVTDAKNGEMMAGATVVVTSPALQGTQTAITDEHGFFKITGLPPGTYAVEFYYADTTVRRDGVKVGANKETPVYQKIATNLPKGETIQVTASAPTIDPTSTTQGITIDKQYIKNVPLPGRTFESTLGSSAGSQSDSRAAPVKQGDDKLKAVVDKVLKAKRDVLIEAHGLSDADAKSRGESVRNKLVDDGIPAARIHIMPKADGPGSVRVLAIAPGAKPEITAPPTATTRGPSSDAPVGESHFWAERPMTVKSGTSAMVAMVHGATTGGVVYLYDPISDRGDKRYAFKAVRLENPTADTLEPGPVTVYGDGRFIGEGITEPVPPKASVVVPFALDRQIVVERTGADEDRIAKLLTVQRGIVTAEVQHRRNTRFTVTSRLAVPTKVYIRHKLAPEWTLVDAPSKLLKVGDSHLFEVDLKPGQTATISIVEATPVDRSLELSSKAALDMMKVYVDEPEASPALRAQIQALLATHRASADLVDKIQTLREQLAEYRSRSGELHAQLVTLKAVKTGGDLMNTLRGKLAETSERVQKATIELVGAQEQLMLARVKFQNQLADLRLTDIAAPRAASRK